MPLRLYRCTTSYTSTTLLAINRTRASSGKTSSQVSVVKSHYGVYRKEHDLEKATQ